MLINFKVPKAKTPSLLLRAAVVLPVSRPPIRDGAVLVSGNRIAHVGRWNDLTKHETRKTGRAVVDLGDSILMPGFVNAHCHLDYTNMAGLVPPQNSFTDWIKLITTAKADWSYTEFAESWLAGARMLLRTGTTTVADFEAVPELLPEVWTATPLRVISFLELTGVKSRRDPRAILNEAMARIESLHNERCRATIAPHAPYSTVPELLRLSAKAARRHGWPISIHVGESAEEYEMIRHRQGEMFHWLKRNERDMGDCGLGSPVQHLDRAGALGKNLLAVHMNYLGREDATLLGRRKVSVAHCPRSHRYFQHRAFPFGGLSRAKVNVCLGTDSLATVFKRRRETVQLDMFEEMRVFSAKHPKTPARAILRMATANGAHALGMKGSVGELTRGAFADIIVIPFKRDRRDANRAVLNHEGEVAASMIDGEWAIAPK